MIVDFGQIYGNTDKIFGICYLQKKLMKDKSSKKLWMVIL